MSSCELARGETSVLMVQDDGDLHGFFLGSKSSLYSVWESLRGAFREGKRGW